MPDANRPNLLLITTDQQRFDTVGPRAPDFLRTPHTDTLCNQGVTFTNGYTSAPNCIPARTSIMTGTTQPERGVTGARYGNQKIDRETSLPSLLRDRGYQTAAIGKMHFDSQHISPRVKHGFDEMIPMIDYYREKERSQSTSRQPMRHGLGQTSTVPAKSTVPEGETLTAWIVEEVVDYIRERRDPTLPFFVWCSLPKPHPPWDPPEPYYSMYDDVSMPDPVHSEWGSNHPGMSEHTLAATRRAYYGLVTQTDYHMGRLFGALNESGTAGNTMLLFTSDHGEYLGDHGRWAKLGYHEPSAHVPFVLYPPQSLADRPSGERCDTPVQLADILPTFVSAAGGDPTLVSDGQDLLALARGEWETPREYAVGAVPSHYAALTDGDWKYIWYPQEDGEEREHLFDLRTDPYETENLASDPDYQERRTELRTALIDRLERDECAFVEDGRLVPLDPEATRMRDEVEQSALIRTETIGQHYTDYYRDRDVLH